MGISLTFVNINTKLNEFLSNNDLVFYSNINDLVINWINSKKTKKKQKE